MRIKFHLHCKTSFGENVNLHIGEVRFPMYYTHDYCWELVIGDVDAEEMSWYNYSIERDGKLVKLSRLNRFAPHVHCKSLEIFDDFDCGDLDVYQSAPFTRCYYPHAKEKGEQKGSLLQVYAPLVDTNCTIAILGAQVFLGEWQEQRAVPLHYVGKGWWQIGVNNVEYIEYKFVIIKNSDHQLVCWEEGDNRIDVFERGKCQVKNLIFRSSKRWHGSGVAIPLFSLRTENDWGIGEFLDLKYLAKWALERNLKMLQILPINDTTHTFTNADSYPYRAISIYALHPIYINVDAVGKVSPKLRVALEKKRVKLNDKEAVDYEGVLKLKMQALRHLFTHQEESFSMNSDYQAFFAKNAHWLLSYAVFSCLRDEYHTCDYSQWKDFAVYSRKKVENYVEKHRSKVDFYYFLQYHADKQLREAHEYVNNKGIALKGDLPIGISPNSVDAWMEPKLFHLDKQAGAPPDDFSKNGQNWGFPTYNWAKMAEKGFVWWKNRFQAMSSYFDAYRIDHILGFFRIWEIPNECVDGVLGYFNPALPLSPQEIYYKGIRFDASRMAEPYLHIEELKTLFGNDYQKVAETFLSQKNAEQMSFRPEYATQRSMQQYFETHPQKWSAACQRKLLNLYTEVLFVEDSYKRGYYHPRISPFATSSYSHLSKEEREAFSALHEDYFYKRHNSYWKDEALRKLPILLRTNDMLVCGEDLGMVPECVPNVMEILHILSLEVQRMPKRMGVEFVLPSAPPYLSVYTTGTHDTSTFRAWWYEDRQRAQRYYQEVLGHKGKSPRVCTPKIVEEVLAQCMSARSMLYIFPMQDMSVSSISPAKERINEPSNAKHCWCYRMHDNL